MLMTQQKEFSVAAIKRTIQNGTRKSLTVNVIENAIAKDGGTRYKELLRKHLPLIEDAYREENGGFRSHLGASQIGKTCTRSLWYGWRWVREASFPPRILRLFNRGHLEEGRFLALLEMIDVTVHMQEDGGQERVSAYNGHFGSALDGVLYGVPEAPLEWMLGEFKTHNTKSFVKLVNEGGVRATKIQHFAQMQVCMHLRGIHKCLYLAVNKNDDDLYSEIVEYDEKEATRFLKRAERVIFNAEIPKRVSEDPANFGCKNCEHYDICHKEAPVKRHCRTCRHSYASPDGHWECIKHKYVLTKTHQERGCEDFSLIPGVKN